MVMNFTDIDNLRASQVEVGRNAVRMSAMHGQQHVAGQDYDGQDGIQAYRGQFLDNPQRSVYARYSARSTSHKPGHDYLLQGGSQKERSFYSRHLYHLK